MFNSEQQAFIKLIENKFGENYTLSRKEIFDLYIENKPDIKYPNWILKEPFKIGHGKYCVPSLSIIESVIEKTMNTPASVNVIENVVSMKKVVHNTNNDGLIPEKDPNFEKFGFYSELKTIIKSKKMIPIFLVGESGTGKTYLVQQICAELKRECIRINLSTETSSEDLIGGNTLIQGDIVFQEGPLITGMRRGACVLLDECDRVNASNILIINGILEGSSYYNPKTNELIKAKEGFNIIATANTRGTGCEDSGKYIAQILDAAFLERFAVTLEQPFPNTKIESKILSHHTDDIDFIEKLVKFAQIIRKTYENGGIGEIISTRRLVHIVQIYNMFGNKLKAIDFCCSRYEKTIKDSFVDLFQKLDSGISVDENGNAVDENEVEAKLKPEPAF